jgi:hypothetical protein
MHTGKPSTSQDQTSPQLSDTNAEINPLATNTPNVMGHFQIILGLFDI